MKEVDEKARQIYDRLSHGENVKSVKATLCHSEEEWNEISNVVYHLYLEAARNARDEYSKSSNTSNEEIRDFIDINHLLADYALCFPLLMTSPEYKQIKNLVSDLPSSEYDILSLIESITMEPRLRGLQQKGRFEIIPVFKKLAPIINAGVLCYFAGNYISACLTLMAVIEGVILRWMGYDGYGQKPTFKKIKQFLAISHQRQPCPNKPLFHEVWVKEANKIIEDHLFKHSESGEAYPNFNRHLAAHLLTDSQFATRENCLRLCLLLDIMSEIYICETLCKDERWNIEGETPVEIMMKADISPSEAMSNIKIRQ